MPDNDRASSPSETFAPPDSGPIQPTLPLRAPRHESDQRPSDPEAPLIPARILNEFVYCPRLAYLEWVQKEWQASSDTVEGLHAHTRVDRPGGTLPEPDEDLEALKSTARSVDISSKELDLVAKIDLVESENGEVRPVDYKRGKRPHIPRHAYDPERVQLCAQGLLLEEHGYRCSEGILYYVGSRERVHVPFDDELRALTLRSIEGLRTTVDGGQIPPPLEDSPKCPRCSLVGICLPDETNLLRTEAGEVRPLAVKHTRALPVYVQSYKGKVAKEGERLVITKGDDDEPIYARLAEVSQLVLMGNIYVTTPTLQELMKRDIPVTWQSHGGWFAGHTIGTGHANVELRTAQYKGSFEEQVCLKLARGWVQAKIRNCRTLLRRNHRTENDIDPILTNLKRLADQAARARDIQVLLGIEGAAAAQYFQSFNDMLKHDGDAPLFEMQNRNRRPPTDPVNALLSFGYTMLTRAFTVTLSAVGFDAYRGYFHRPRYGRPALSLDMMEPFRPLIVDSVVITAINNGEVRPTDFTHTPIGVNLSASGRKRFIGAFERRMGQEVTHPMFGYQVDYRRLIEIQARLLGRFLLGEILEYPNFTTR